MLALQRYRQSEIAILEKPDLAFVKLLMPPEGFQTLGVEGVVNPLPINRLKTVEDFDKELGEVLDAVKIGTTPPPSFFVPDLWHVAKGRAKYMPPDDGETLWQACVMALQLGNTYYQTRTMASVNNHPGNTFREPLDEPNFIEE